jgi:hypothetical protein
LIWSGKYLSGGGFGDYDWEIKEEIKMEGKEEMELSGNGSNRNYDENKKT